jgi:hypothetical protein
MTTLASLNIREGSNKEKVAKMFLEKGKDAAVKKAASLGLEESTARTWCSAWGKGGAKKKAKKAPAKKAAKAAPKKTAKKAAKKSVKRERVEAQPSA